MRRLNDLLKRLLARATPRSQAEISQLRSEFQERYHAFKLLIAANNQSLEIMAEIERALACEIPFGMTFVRSRLARVATHVLQMIRLLESLAPGVTADLGLQFKEIQGKVEQSIAPRARPAPGALVVRLDDVDRTLAPIVGRKNAYLGEIRSRLGRRVPAGFAVTYTGFQAFMQHHGLQMEIDRQKQAAGAESIERFPALSARLQGAIIEAEVPRDLADAIREGFRSLCRDATGSTTVAVRSSALGEDTEATSFAGQHRSELNVSGESLLDAFKEVVASKYSVPAMTYRLSRGIRDVAVAMCVGFHQMVWSAAGGVLYTKRPNDQTEDDLIISATVGLPKPIVDGTASADLFVVARGDPPVIRVRRIVEKQWKTVCRTDEGTEQIETTPGERFGASLDDEQVLELARAGLALERHFGSPQDVEWVLEEGRGFTLLQCRPLCRRQPLPAEVPSEPAPKVASIPLLVGGVRASPGIAAGPVHVLAGSTDALQFPEGSVLVAKQSLPHWAALLSRASALITEQGTVAGHLASVAREFGLPALFGVNGALDRLATGQEITLDADACAIYAGRVSELLDRRPPRPHLMEGSPVHETLKGAAQYVNRLTLLDPDAPDFKPENCRTLHDLTRLCHEQSVREMFRFGKDHAFPERSSKQLFHEVPMDWWILNLDDGFRNEIEEKYVLLEDIVSIPMLALWDGITSIPWEGPPPLDGRGFMSVMFGATTNPALNPGIRSSYVKRNYFLIARHYCSLNTRLGAHFSSIEAMVSERRGENHITFQFKGGAADDDRRLKRARFVQQILEECGFFVTISGDQVTARLEGFEADYMCGRLRILGYLTIHTRQLDMVMARPKVVEYYRKKIRDDIRSLGPAGRNPTSSENAST